jgi:hypothetical protein
LGGGPFPTSCGSDVPLSESHGNLPERDGTTGPDVLDNRPNIRSPALGLARPDDSTGHYSLPGHEVNLAPVPSSFAPGFVAAKASSLRLEFRHEQVNPFARIASIPTSFKFFLQ